MTILPADTSADGGRLAPGVRVYTPRSTWGTVRGLNRGWQPPRWLVDEDGYPRARTYPHDELYATPGFKGQGPVVPADPAPERAWSKTCDAPNCSNPLPAGRRRFCSDDCRRAGHRHERVTETAEFAKMCTRMVRRLARRIGDSDTDEFRAVWELLDEADHAAVLAIDDLRAKGYDYGDLAASIDSSRQQIRQWRTATLRARRYPVPDGTAPAADDDNEALSGEGTA